MEKKQTLRLNEAQLKKVVAESVKRMLNESESSDVRRICDELEGIKGQVSSLLQEIFSDERFKYMDNWMCGKHEYYYFFMKDKKKIDEGIDSMIQQYRKFYNLN